ncbi:hypothetical protein L7F22_014598 [Adiantum nelumboides]|nr:hypothetical protein [Adiantum nelumboides]
MDPVYISHGSPMLPLEDIPARDFLRHWRQYLSDKPKAIVAISAHWNTAHPSVTTTPQNTTIHDFYGFPPELYKLQYNAPGEPELARQVKGLLQAAGFGTVQEDTKWGLDHGAWVPLYLMYPEADIPVIQLSVQPSRGGLHHYNLGKALLSLKNEGVLIMASGSATHNLRYISSSNVVPAWASEFDDWLNDALSKGRFEEVIDFEKYAPNAKKVHPSPEHFYPLLVALGAAGENAKACRIHTSWAHSALSMACFSFSIPLVQNTERSRDEGTRTLKDSSCKANTVGSEDPDIKGNLGNRGGFLGRFFTRAGR